MISKHLIIACAPSNIGQQVHVNHDGCKAGEDTKRRLYIKRTSGGLLAYCHHCNDKGFVVDKSFEGEELKKWLHGKGGEVHDVTYGDPSAPLLHRTEELDDVVMEDWLRDTYIAYKDIYDSDFMFPCTKGIAFKLHGKKGDVIGTQVRTYTGKPKYLTRFYPGATDDVAWFTMKFDRLDEITKPKLFITEDWLSAYRIFRDTPHKAVALLRTTISDKTIIDIHRMTEDIDKVCVWLDPDDAGKKGSKIVCSRLRAIIANPVIEYVSDYEPKELEPKDLLNYCDPRPRDPIIGDF